MEKRIRACLLANGGQFDHFKFFEKSIFFFRFDVVLAKIPENFMYLSGFLTKVMNFYSSNFVGWDILNGSPCT